MDKIKLDTPTVKSGLGWLICNTSLGCGLKVLQGWSKGIGIDGKGNETEFEKRLFTLLYLSKYPDHAKNPWHRESCNRSVEAPISVHMNRWQFLHSGSTYVLNSTEEWANRFINFVNKHKLGDISKTHGWKNSLYRGDTNITFVWTWNGTIPLSKNVGIDNWELPE